MTQLLLACGAIAGPLFIIIFLIEGWLRPGYDALRQSVSSLSQGPRGWIQQFNFFSSGALLAAFAFGLRAMLAPLGSTWTWLLIFSYALGLIGAGLFITDAGSGAPRTRAGIIHDLFSTVVFFSLCIDCFVFAHLFARRGLIGWEWYSLITGVFYAAGFIIFARAFSPKSRWVSIGGLLQKITISIGALWLASVAIELAR